MKKQIHSSSKISKLCDIEESPRGTNLTIGENSQIDSFVKIKPVGGSGNIEIGANCYINSGTVIYSGNGVLIKNNVLIGPNCNIVPVNHEFRSANLLIREQGFKENRGGVVIEDDVWLGANVTLMDGAVLSKGSVIAANSVVNFKTEQYGVYAGVPAKKIKMRE